jgi:hypothetical protein
MLWSNLWQKLAVVWAKNADFSAKIFRRFTKKNITSVPGSNAYSTLGVTSTISNPDLHIPPICLPIYVRCSFLSSPRNLHRPKDIEWLSSLSRPHSLNFFPARDRFYKTFWMNFHPQLLDKIPHKKQQIIHYLSSLDTNLEF